MGAMHPSHKTRFSDSSLFDEICVYCLHTDSDRERRLEKPCPAAPVQPPQGEDEKMVGDGGRIETLRERLANDGSKTSYWIRSIGPGWFEVNCRATGRPICQVPQTDDVGILRAIAYCPDDLSVRALCEALTTAQEHRQIAAVVCLDLDILEEVARNGGVGVSLLAQVAHTHQKKEAIVKDAGERKKRYDSAVALFRLSEKGLLVKTPLDAIGEAHLANKDAGGGI